MTPKEKAKELVEKYQQVEVSAMYTDEDNDVCIASDKMYAIPSIECAIIVVKEILELDVTWIRQSIADDYPKNYSQDQTKEYWYQVFNILKSMQS